MANNPLTTLNLLEHDDSHVGVQLVKAQTVIGSGGSLTLRDLQGDEVEADKTLHIAQNGTVVAEGDYGFRLTTAPGDGLYVNYGLKALNIHGGQKLTLAEHGGAYGATADMSAKIGGEGDLAINTVRQVSLSNGQNDYQGATYVQMGTLRTDADGALGNTRELNISNAAIVDLNGSTQTVETFTGQMGSTVLFKEGALTVNKGGISQGELTGGGNLNVTGGTLAIEGLNARYNALTSISPNAEVSLDNTQGLGRGNIANDGLLTLKNVTGELRNSISGKGIVSATARTDVELDGDNSRFVGQFNIQVFQWLIGATDGHAKNFSVFIQAGGSYRLTPFYDIISAFPVLGGTGIHISDLKLAMGLNASKGKKTAIDKIYPRHFLATAKVLRFPEVQMHEILSDFARMIPAALDNVKTSLPTDFPENVVTAVETNVLRLHGRLSREYGSK